MDLQFNCVFVHETFRHLKFESLRMDNLEYTCRKLKELTEDLRILYLRNLDPQLYTIRTFVFFCSFLPLLMPDAKLDGYFSNSAVSVSKLGVIKFIVYHRGKPRSQLISYARIFAAYMVVCMFWIIAK